MELQEAVALSLATILEYLGLLVNLKTAILVGQYTNATFIVLNHYDMIYIF